PDYGANTRRQRSMVRGPRALRAGEQGQGEHRQARQDRGDERFDLRSARPDGARLGNQEGQKKRDDPEVLSRLPDREYAFARRKQSTRWAHLVFHSRDTRGDWFCRDERQTDPDAPIGSRQHARANERARRKGETESQL